MFLVFLFQSVTNGTAYQPYNNWHQQQTTKYSCLPFKASQLAHNTNYQCFLSSYFRASQMAQPTNHTTIGTNSKPPNIPVYHLKRHNWHTTPTTIFLVFLFLSVTNGTVPTIQQFCSPFVNNQFGIPAMLSYANFRFIKLFPEQSIIFLITLSFVNTNKCQNTFILSQLNVR